MIHYYPQVKHNPSSIAFADHSLRLAVDPIKGQVQPQVHVDPSAISANSNHATGPQVSSTGTGGEHKMPPAAIGSERKRQMPTPSATTASTALNGTGDWSSVPKRKLPPHASPASRDSLSLSCSLQSRIRTHNKYRRRATI